MLNTKEEIVAVLVKEWGFRSSQFYNNETNKQVEKIWTLNRCARYLGDLKKNYVMTETGMWRKTNPHVLKNTVKNNC
jgi:hypothetical protein